MFVIFFSSGKNSNSDSDFWQWLSHIIYCADKAGVWAEVKKIQIFVTVSVWEPKIIGKINENLLFCLIFMILGSSALYYVCDFFFWSKKFEFGFGFLAVA